MKNLIQIILLFFAFTSCNSTRIISSWKEPNKALKIRNLNKVLVVALFKNETSNHQTEDEMVQYLNGKGVVSYDYLKANFNKEKEEAIRIKIKKDGFDGAITMRLLDVDKETNYSRGSISSYPVYYQTFSGYYFRNMNYYNEPGYYTTTKTYTVETNVFSIKEDKIIWTGLTETTNPDGVDKMTKEIVKVVYQKMIDEGFIQK